MVLSEKPGPVYLEIPEDILEETWPFNDTPLSQYECPAINVSGQIAQASNILLEAQRMAVIMGNGLRWAEPFEELRALVENYHLPCITPGLSP
jgi:thiamine pyrophosphate-dependent acetolactate synthase large subunit-like protein